MSKPCSLSWHTLYEYLSIWGEASEKELWDGGYYVIHLIMRILINKHHVVDSWGAHGFRVALGLDDEMEEGVEFAVHGYKFEGTVRIVYVQGCDLFRVDIGHLGRICYTQKEIHRDMLVDVIDEYVELTDDYSERVNETYGLG